MAKKNKSKKKSLNSTEYPFGLYKTLEAKKLQMGYGDIVIPENDFIIMPHNLPIQKKLIATIEEKFTTDIHNVDLNDKSVLVMRYGGIGDIISSLFGIAELKRKYPRVTIGYLCSPSYAPILTQFRNLIDGTANVIVSYNNIKDFKYFVLLDDVVESDPRNQTMSIQDLYAEHLGIKIQDDTLEHIQSISSLTNPKGFPRRGIGIQYTSNAPIRNYDIDNICNVINRLVEIYPGKHIYLLGRANDYVPAQYIQSKTEGRVFVNGCGGQELSLIQEMELVSELEVVLAPDSAMLHIAGVCNTPMVGLFGPFPSKLRISKYNNAIGIDGQASCSPCFRHFPQNWCKYNSGSCMCLNSITPETIVDAIGNFITPSPIVVEGESQLITPISIDSTSMSE